MTAKLPRKRAPRGQAFSPATPWPGPVRALVVLAGALALTAGLHPAPADAATVVGLRHSSDPERTRVVLDLDRAGDFTHRALSDPPRVVVALPRGAFAAGVAPRAVEDGFVRGVRLNTLRSGTIQVVLDLGKPLDYSIFTLTGPHRIVIDVRHQGAPVPAVPSTGGVAGTTPPGTTPGPSGNAPTGASPRRAPVEAVAPSRGEWVIAIDAGHGGQDHGARHHDTSEKDITLALARGVMRELESYEGIRAFLVRKGDYFIPLRRRWTLAEKQGANLFVSIHCNASKDKKAAGTEVFFLSLKGATDEAAKELAQRENAVDAKMGVETAESNLDEIIFDMRQTDVLTKSQLLAEFCLENLYQLGTVYNRGVKQAGFAVLKSPRMPSVLVEAAFISNKRENKMLRDGNWQREFGKLLADGLTGYCHNVEGADTNGGGRRVAGKGESSGD